MRGSFIHSFAERADLSSSSSRVAGNMLHAPYPIPFAMVAAAVASSGGVTLVVEALSVYIGLHVDLVLASAQPKVDVEMID